MYRQVVVLLLVFFSWSLNAHEWTPTYPKLEQSFVSNVLVANMSLFNNRKNIRYYEISVFDADWNPVAYSTGGNSILKISYLQRKKVAVYIRKRDRNKATYICSRSKSLLNADSVTYISSRICSKIK